MILYKDGIAFNTLDLSCMSVMVADAPRIVAAAGSLVIHVMDAIAKRRIRPDKGAIFVDIGKSRLVECILLLHDIRIVTGRSFNV
jgi:hypothetical protein